MGHYRKKNPPETFIKVFEIHTQLSKAKNFKDRTYEKKNGNFPFV